MEDPKNILKDELWELAPELSKLERKNSFAVPDDYFDNLSFRIQNKVSSKKEEHRSWFSIILKPQYSIAASISIILIVSGIFYYNHSQKQYANNETIYWDEIIGENNSINYNFDENSLVETLADLTPETESDQIINTDNTLNNISTDDINDYLKSNNNDVFYEN